jgi:sulfotransferase family protein
MALKIVGTGLGRTGTKSMQTALAMLGFGPCHHMLEVFQHPESMQLWVDAGEGRPDWDAIFKDYNSAVDYPSAAYWREITSHYPDAKVLHTVRDPD